MEHDALTQKRLDAERRQQEVDAAIQSLEMQEVRVGLNEASRERLAELRDEQLQVFNQVNAINAQPMESDSEKEAREAAEAQAKAEAEAAQEEETPEEVAARKQAQFEADTAAKARIENASTPEELAAVMTELGLT